MTSPYLGKALFNLWCHAVLLKSAWYPQASATSSTGKRRAPDDFLTRLFEKAAVGSGWQAGIGNSRIRSGDQGARAQIRLANQLHLRFWRNAVPPDDRVTLHARRHDDWAIPPLHVDCAMGANKARMAQQILADGEAIFEAAGGVVVNQAIEAGLPGLGSTKWAPHAWSEPR